MKEETEHLVRRQSQYLITVPLFTQCQMCPGLFDEERHQLKEFADDHPGVALRSAGEAVPTCLIQAKLLAAILHSKGFRDAVGDTVTDMPAHRLRGKQTAKRKRGNDLPLIQEHAGMGLPAVPEEAPAAPEGAPAAPEEAPAASDIGTEAGQCERPAAVGSCSSAGTPRKKPAAVGE